MNRKLVLVGIGVAVLLVTGYLASPYWAIRQMQSAANGGEGDRLSAYVDFPAVRESVKTQVQAALVRKAAEEGKDNPFAALGMMLVSGMANAMVDNLITAEGLAGMIRAGKAEKPAMAAQGPAGRTPEPESSKAQEPVVRRHYEGLGYFHVDMSEPGKEAPALSLVLKRDGLFSWKLVAVRLPFLAQDTAQPGRNKP